MELARIGIQAMDGLTVSDFSGRLWRDVGVHDDIGYRTETRLWSD